MAFNRTKIITEQNRQKPAPHIVQKRGVSQRHLWEQKLITLWGVVYAWQTQFTLIVLTRQALSSAGGRTYTQVMTPSKHCTMQKQYFLHKIIQILTPTLGNQWRTFLLANYYSICSTFCNKTTNYAGLTRIINTQLAKPHRANRNAGFSTLQMTINCNLFSLHIYCRWSC